MSQVSEYVNSTIFYYLFYTFGSLFLNISLEIKVILENTVCKTDMYCSVYTLRDSQRVISTRRTDRKERSGKRLFSRDNTLNQVRNSNMRLY